LSGYRLLSGYSYMSGFRLLSGYIYPVHTGISQETAIIRMQNTMENGTAGSDVGWHRE
jgi:hypothetical protein